MGLKNCVYCTTPISEHATVCPNPECKRDYPFDGERKSRITAGFAEDRALKEVEAKVYTQAYLCPECGKTFLTRDALRCGHTRPTAACPSCGYPRFYIKCHRCEKQADGYDARQQVFVCYQHTIERCVACGMLIHDTSINCQGVGLPLTIKTITYMHYLAHGDEFGVLRSWRWADLYAKR